MSIIIEFLKKHIVPIVIFVVAGIVLCVLNIRLSILKKDTKILPVLSREDLTHVTTVNFIRPSCRIMNYSATVSRIASASSSLSSAAAARLPSSSTMYQSSPSFR